ncbi:SR-related and CTD-associated factor 4-like isoform X2 [Daphnia pulex]|uniref:SR-related and CTD-associated factor 4-like isoform X2 n=1 Tax=Daphnia pulex TaxID=6669 RepID=UPI001EDE4B91|nr:SR-related and CTD-associated factor 4-like isoform X2 [Daphnia pulex]
MDTVKAFNAELSSLYDMKPPISKAKMTAITKGAIKAVKFYKHVVQSVEKFLQKCRPEYKIPGLYVIDSIVRQSRHQFGADKDVFAPRFSKNVTYTFYFIYQCTGEEKSKVIRVLNLWQKNAVFPPEVIQPLFDMADSSHPKFKEVAQYVNSKGASSSGISAGKSNSQDNTTNLNGNNEAAVSFEETSNDGNQSQSLVMGNLPNLSSTEMSLATRLQHLQHLFGQEPPNNSSNPLAAQPLTPAKVPANANDTGQIRFNKKLLDFDYDEEDEEPDKTARETGQQQAKPQPPPPQQPVQPALTSNSTSESLGTLLTNPDILRHLQSLQQQIAQPAVQSASISTNHHHHHQQQQQHHHHQQQQQHEEQPIWEPANNHGQYGQIDFTQPPPGFMPMGAAGLSQPPVGFPHHHPPHPPNAAAQFQQHHQPPTIREDLFQPGNGEVIEIDPPRSKERERRRSRSGSRGRRARSGGRHGGRRSSRSRSRSRDRGGVRRRSRSRSRSRNTRARPRSRSRDQEREKERLEREKERDRKRRGLPPTKKEALSVCSTTLWVGHLSKLVQQEELSDTFGQYGEILSIDLIPPRGCAFVCMHRRQDAYRALTKLAGHKLQGKAITLAWAPGKGVKAKEWKDFWEVDQGVSYVPWQRLSQMTDLEALEEGGSFDEETLPPWLRHHLNQDDKIGQQRIPMAPTGFIPIPEAGPPTPEMNEPSSGGGQAMSTASGPSSLNTATTTLPANLPTYAAMAPHSLGLLPVPLGMPPGLRLPPPGTAAHLLMSQAAGAGTNAAMATHLLGQSILAGLGAAAAAQGLGPSMGQPAGPSGFFNVFNPHLPGHPHQQQQQPPPQIPSHDDADDMELEEADDDVHQQQQHHKEMDGRNRSGGGWNEQMDDRSDMLQLRQPLQHRTPDKSNNGPGLLDRLRSLANHEAGSLDHHHHHHNNNGSELAERGGGGPLHLRTDMAGPGSSVPDQYGLSPNLASSLRGVPLTAAAAEMGIRLLRGGPPDAFGTPGRGIGGDDPFMPRQPHLGGSSFGPVPDNFGPMRGRHFGHDSRGGRGGGGGGGGFRGDMVEPAWDEEPLPPPRWRQQEDWSDREPPPPSRWDRDRDRDRDHSGSRGGRGGADWSSPRRPPLPPLPPRSNDRGSSNRDRYGGGSRGGGDRGSDRRRSGDRDRDPPPPRDRERRTSERRSSGRWSDRKSPDPAAPVPSSSSSSTVPVPPPVPAPPPPPVENNDTVPIPGDAQDPPAPTHDADPSASSVCESQSADPSVVDNATPATSVSRSPPAAPPASSPTPPPPTLASSDADLTAPGTEEEEPPSAD